MDVAGDNQLNIEHDMYKQRLSPTGIAVGKPGVEIIGEVSRLTLRFEYLTIYANLRWTKPHRFHPTIAAHVLAQSHLFAGYNLGYSQFICLVTPLFRNFCKVESAHLQLLAPASSFYSCGHSFSHRCCNTCDDVRKAYDDKGWNVAEVLKTSEQCLRDKKNPFAAVRRGEGCRVAGVMSVNKVAGNFHVALGDSIVRDGRHIHQFIPSEAPGFNVSHTVHSLSFGLPYPSMPINPLDSGNPM